MTKFIFRVLYITLVRFFVLTALLTSLLYFDASPLPQDATIVALSYLLHALVTFLFARWVFAKRTSPTWAEAGIVSAIFVIVGTLFELGLRIAITGSSLISALKNFTWQSLLIVIIYVLAVYAAAWQTRVRRARRTHTEGLSE